ncbi:MAG: hypothetical protein AAGA56_24885, partial [Myxococcota bacterium]
ARILAGYDLLLWQGLAVGLRAGVAFPFTPGSGEAQERFEDCEDAGNERCRAPSDPSFLPFHGELRVSYYFPGRDGFAGGLVRPYGFVGFGVAQVDAGVKVGLCDFVDENGAPVAGDGDNGCPDTTDFRGDIDAVQLTGPLMVPFGVGSLFAISDNFGVNVEAKFMAMLSNSGFVIAPNFGPVYMFE